jgi:hypothetical protein
MNQLSEVAEAILDLSVKAVEMSDRQLRGS